MVTQGNKTSSELKVTMSRPTGTGSVMSGGLMSAGSAETGSYFRVLTALAITSPRMTRDPTACTVMASLAQRASGITSVGLNAVALVKPR